MPLYIKDDETASLVGELAAQMNTTKQDAVKSAVKMELARLSDQRSFDERLRDFYKRFPKPVPTGLKADKAFFDDLSGEFD